MRPSVSRAVCFVSSSLAIASLPACRKEAPPVPPADCTTRFAPLLGEIPWAAMAAGWSSAPDNVYLVGGRHQVPAVLHYDGRAWERMELGIELVPKAELLWWIHGVSPTSIWAVGEAGAAVRYDGRAWRTSTTATDATLSGVWGVADDDIWAVGGYPGASKERGVIIHHTSTWLATVYQTDTSGQVIDADIVGDCTEKTSSILASRQLVTKQNLFKVWGTSRDNVFAVGTGGLILRYYGRRWHCGGVDPSISFTTVYGRGPKDVFAVGSAAGGTEAAVYHYDGEAWSRWPTPTGQPPLLGVWADDQQVIVVGHLGGALRAGPDGGAWTPIDTGTALSLHHVFKVGNDILASGGNLLDPSVDRHGFVLSLCSAAGGAGGIAGGGIANTDGGLDARLPPPKGMGETRPGERCTQDTDCQPGLACYWVYGGQICAKRCTGDPDCFGGSVGDNPCCTASSQASGQLVCAPAHHCPPDW